MITAEEFIDNRKAMGLVRGCLVEASSINSENGLVATAYANLATVWCHDDQQGWHMLSQFYSYSTEPGSCIKEVEFVGKNLLRVTYGTRYCLFDFDRHVIVQESQRPALATAKQELVIVWAAKAALEPALAVM